MDLTKISTADLRAELGKRFQAPLWAEPILSAVAIEAGITVEELVTNLDRSKRQVIWRDTAIVLLRRYVATTLVEIAAIWKLDHTTIITTIRKWDRNHPHDGRWEGPNWDFYRRCLIRITKDGGDSPRRTAPQVKTGPAALPAQ